MKPISTASEQEGINREFAEISAQQGLLPVKVTPFYQKKVRDEVAALGDNVGPLHRAVYPSRDRLDQHTPGEVKDFVDDREKMPKGLQGVGVRKYRERMLFFPTDRCLAHCQYCFRTDVLSEEHARDKVPTLAEKLAALVDYLRSTPEIEEVILSGGDPMNLGLQQLRQILEALREQTNIEAIRIHTRALAFAPQVFSEEKARLLGEFDVRLVSHVIHPYEICDEVKQYIDRLRKNGVRLYNQFPLLRKINDHVQVLVRLLKELDRHAIRNLSIFIPDPITYSTTFRLRIRRLFKLIQELNWSTPSWINSTRFVIDTPHGKVKREDFVEYDETRQVAIFEREGNRIEYPDIGEKHDEPGDLKTLLWKDHI